MASSLVLVFCRRTWPDVLSSPIVPRCSPKARACAAGLCATTALFSRRENVQKMCCSCKLVPNSRAVAGSTRIFLLFRTRIRPAIGHMQRKCAGDTPGAALWSPLHMESPAKTTLYTHSSTSETVRVRLWLNTPAYVWHVC